MSYALIILIVFGLFMLIWFGGLLVYGYHVFAYGMPGDKTRTSLYILIASVVAALLVVSYVLSGLNWEAV